MISYELFEKSIHAILTKKNRDENFSNFLEENVCTSHYCVVDYGNEIVDILIQVLCKTFNLETNNEYYGNDISWWLYENVEKIIYFEDGTQRDISDLHDFYDYLVEQSMP